MGGYLTQHHGMITRPASVPVLVVRICLVATLMLLGRSTEAEGFKMYTRSVLIPERGEVVGYVVMTSSNRFSFLPPPGWNVTDDARESMVTMVPEDFGAKLSFKITDQKKPTSLKEMQTDAFRETITNRYPDAKIVREFLCYTGSAQGITFDVERLSDKRPPVMTRLAFVPLKGGQIEFNLTTESRRFDRYHRVFGNLMTSFRVEAIPPAK